MRHGMRIAIGFVFAFVFLQTQAAPAQEGAFVRHSLLDGLVTVELPSSLQPMSEEMKRTKYPGANRPSVAFSGADGTVSFGINWTAHRLEARNVSTQTTQLRGQLEKVSRVLRWHATEVLTVDGREIGLLDFDTQAVDSEIRNRMLLTELGGRLLLMTFNMTKALEPQWLAPSERVVRSVRFRR